MNRASSRLAARGEIRQVEAVIHADRAAAAAEAAVRRVWSEVLRLLKAIANPLDRTPVNPWDAHSKALAIFRQLLPVTAHAIGKRLEITARWGHRSSVKAMQASVPVRALQAAASIKSIRRRSLGESVGLQEDFPGQQFGLFDLWKPFRGILTPGEEPGEGDRADGEDAEPVIGSTPDLLDFLFPPPSQSLLDRVVYGDGWHDRLRSSTKLGGLYAPETLANLLAGGLAAGKTPQQIANDLLPAVDGVRVTARRIARTECMRIAGSMQDGCDDQLGDLVIGKQLRSTMDSHTRSWHAARNGVIYYRNPKPGQKGYYQRPNPPDEPDDPNERPAGTPKIAWSCRCHLVPVLRDPGNIAADHPAFTNNRGALVPDPATYSDWFATTDEKRKRIAVGTKRFNVVRDTLQREPVWSDFLSLSGELLPVDVLSRETHTDRIGRMTQVRAKLAHQDRQRQQVSTFGFIHGAK